MEPYTLEYAERETGVPADAIREAAHAYATADRAMICWTLGITEHHNAVDNVLALINLSLLTGHVGQVRQRPQPAARPEQRPGRRRHGRAAGPAAGLPARRERRPPRPLRRGLGRDDPAQARLAPVGHVRRDGARRADRRCTCIGENPIQSEADAHRTERLLGGLEFMVVQDIFLTTTAEVADVVLPAAAAWAESEGTVTNSERRVQRVRKALEPPGDARDDLWIIFEIARRMGHDWGEPSAEAVWDELRRSPRCTRGMTYARLEARAASSGRATTRRTRASRSSTRGCGRTRCPGNRAPFVPVEHDPPVDRAGRRLPDPPDDRAPPGLVQHRRPVAAATATRGGAARRWTCARRTSSGWAWRRASGCAWSRGAARSRRRCAPIASLRPGLAFMTFHFQDDVATNLLTIDATDPKSGTAEFKATAIRIEKLGAPVSTPG